MVSIQLAKERQQLMCRVFAREATSMQVIGFRYNSYQGYDTLAEARSHWRHALITGTWGDPRKQGNWRLPPFEGYHIVYHPDLDPSAVPLSQAMRSQGPTTPTTIPLPSIPSFSFHYNSRSTAPEPQTPSSPQLQFPWYGCPLSLNHRI